MSSNVVVPKLFWRMKPDETKELFEFIVAGGEIQSEYLDGNVRHARGLYLSYGDKGLAGCIAIKQSNPDYQYQLWLRALGIADTYESRKTQRFKMLDNAFEIGYLHVSPDARGQGLAKALMERACKMGSSALFATTRIDNEPMLRLLTRFGFKQQGKPFPSKDRPDVMLTFHTKPAKNAPVEVVVDPIPESSSPALAPDMSEETPVPTMPSNPTPRGPQPNWARWQRSTQLRYRWSPITMVQQILPPLRELSRLLDEGDH